MFHYEFLLQMNLYKKLYSILDKEIKDLRKNSALTKSGAKKREKIAALKMRQESLKKEFDLLADLTLNEIKHFPPEQKIYANIIQSHFCDFTKPIDKLQLDIAMNGLAKSASNFRDELETLWFKQF